MTVNERHRSMRWLLSALLAMSAALAAVIQPLRATPAHAAAAASAGRDPWEPLVTIDLAPRMSLAVNTASGNLNLQILSLDMPGVNGLDEVIAPNYNSQGSKTTKDLGDAWTLGTGVDLNLTVAPGSLTWLDPTGHSYVFSEPTSCSFGTPAGLDATMTCGGSGFNLTFHASGLEYQWDGSGHLLDIVNRAGNIIRFGESGGLLTGIGNTEGQTTTVTHECSTCPAISQITDPAGRVWSYTYSSGLSGQLTSMTDPSYGRTSFAIGINGSLSQITDPKGNVTKISYDASNRVTQIVRVTNPSAGTGPTWYFGYGTGTGGVTTPNGSWSYAYDTSNRPTTITYPNGTSSTNSWTGDNHLSIERLPSGSTTTYNYDSLNNLTQITLSSLPGSPSFQWQFANASLPYLPSAFTDEEGHTTIFGYTARGLLNSVTDPLGHTGSAVYNADGTIASLTDENNHTTTYSYTSAGLLSQLTPPAPLGAWSYTYDSADRLSKLTDGKGRRRRTPTTRRTM